MASLTQHAMNSANQYLNDSYMPQQRIMEMMMAAQQQACARQQGYPEQVQRQDENPVLLLLG